MNFENKILYNVKNIKTRPYLLTPKYGEFKIFALSEQAQIISFIESISLLHKIPTHFLINKGSFIFKRTDLEKHPFFTYKLLFELHSIVFY